MKRKAFSLYEMRSCWGNVLLLPDEMPCFHVEGLGDLQKMGNLFLMLLCDPVWFITTNLLILALIHMP